MDNFFKCVGDFLKLRGNFVNEWINFFLNEFWTGVVALTFIGAGYTTEIIRNSVLSLEKGQNEMAK